MKSQKKEILKNQERWDYVAKSCEIGFFDWFPKEDIVIWDDNLYRIAGLSKDEDVKVQEYLMSIVHPQDREEVIKHIGKTLEPGNPDKSYQNQFRIIVDGKIRYAINRGLRFVDEEGVVEKILGFVIDTTTNIEAERRIRDNEERLRIASDATGIGIFDWLVEEDSLYWDENARKIFEVSDDVVDLNTHFFAKIHDEDKARVEESFKRRMSAETSDTSAFDEFRINIDGKIRYITSNGIAKRNRENKVVRVTGTFFDVTDLVLKEKELKESQEYFRTVIEDNVDYIFTINRDFEIVFINHIDPDLSRDDVIGRPMLDFVIPEDKERVKGVIDKVFKNRESGQYYTVYQGPDGPRHYSTQVSPLIADGEVFGATFISRDITKLKLTEQKLEKQANELSITNRNLEQFAYVASHDMKAPINNLEGLVDLMDSQEFVKPEGEQIFEKLKSTIHQMNTTIKTLNEVLTIQRDLTLEEELIRFDKNLEEVLDTITYQLEESGVDVISDFSKGPETYLPPVHLKSIFLNLITNSIKYRRQDVRSFISFHSEVNDEGQVILEIEDNGTGINLDKYSDKLFGLFQRFHLNTTGKGMGLYIIKMILDKYGASIDIESTPGEGTKFTIIFEKN